MWISVFVSLIVFFIYGSWFAFQQTLSSGDWPYLFLENIKEFSFLPPLGFLWLTPYYQITAKLFVEYLGFSWNLAEKILWFWPFVLLSIISSYYLTKSWIGVLIYTINTYVLMLVGGGQMGVALAYSLVPFVLGIFMKLVDVFVQKSSNLKFLVAGLVLAVEMMFDPRVAYISMLAVVLYLLFSINYKLSKENLANIFYVLFFVLLIPAGIALLINSYWVVPFTQVGPPPALKGYTSLAGFEFLSFADFSHTFSLLHPNWPENIFGKVYFLQSEFLLLPIFAYSSLLFLRFNTQNQAEQNPTESYRSPSSTVRTRLTERFGGAGAEQRRILFFALVGLISVFLAKGSNPPFGEVNSFLFQYFPGMSMFRDATKFYILVALSYSVLIPFSVYSFTSWVISNLNTHFKFKIYYVFLLFTILYLLFLIRPAVLGELSGTFKPSVVPREYILLKDFLVNQPQSFKTLWVPKVQRFGFSSKNHPAIEGTDFFGVNSLSETIENLKKPGIEKFLSQSSIKYIIVPDDSNEELFIVDRKYSEKQRVAVVEELKKILWLKQLPSIGRIIIFEV